MAGYKGFLSEIADLLESARRTVARTTNSIITASYWEIGRRIVEFEQRGRAKAKYGEQIIENLSTDLTARFGRGFGAVNLSQMRKFYNYWPSNQIFQTVSEKLCASSKGHTASGQLSIKDLTARFPLLCVFELFFYTQMRGTYVFDIIVLGSLLTVWRLAMNDSILFSSFQLKDFQLKNRIGVAPMTRMSSVKNSIPRRDVFDFLIRRAQKGAAVVYTEAIVTDYECAQGYPGQARILKEKQIEAWKPVVESIRREGAVSIMQMFHCGRMAWPEVNPAGRVIAPSPVAPSQDNPLTNAPYPVPEQISLLEIEQVIEGFIDTAKGAVAAGFDGIEVHGAHGYLISQFLSSYSNKRTDAYGVTVENRYRFAHEVIQAVRGAVPDDRLLMFRISNWGIADMDVSLFESKEEYQKIIQLLSKEPIDAISVSTYRYGDKAFGTDQNMAQITRAVTSLPIMICGGIYDRASAEDALKDADIVLSAKSLLLNPDWVEDVKAGKSLPLYKAEDADIAYSDTPLP